MNQKIKKIKAGTRGSALALAQTQAILADLQTLHPGLEIELIKITTTGDRIQDRFLSEAGGKGLFVKEIEEALKLGKEEANFLIENALFNKARSGNTTAMIFWLKNNWRQKYNDSNKTEEETNLINAQKSLLDIEMELKKKKLQKM